ncbi:DUF6232 family protein [Chryseobacterium sp.]|uniref:DUF6232 family protein n=1 Tax=Chryseobacterium sp. TaxID=1871047 RepID=UPI0011CA9FB4|nr:DUF6232 family protein [Chryseobacterium sp.]TXF78997.1 hypothetical protein FUA25_00980 [Chryseobacterium sp.]
MATQNETVFYHDTNVTVTPVRYVTQSNTYAVRNISSVYIFEIDKSRLKAVLTTLLGIPLLFLGDLFFVGIIMILLGIWWFISIKNEYAVRISTNAGESDSIVSEDKIYIQKIANAVNEAFIQRLRKKSLL